MTEEDKLVILLMPLMQKALYCEGIYRSFGDYDDYFQGLSMVLLDWLRQYPERDALAWQGYLFNRFRWHIRTQRRRQLREAKLVERLALATSGEAGVSLEEDLAAAGVLAQLNRRLSFDERRFLRQRLAGLTVADIARHAKVSRPTVYRWKRRVEAKYGEIAD